MARRTTSVETPVAHLVGPGKLKVVNGQLAYSAAGQGALRLSPVELRMVYCYGDVGVTDAAVELLCRHEVQLAWMTPTGQRCRGRLVQDNASAAPLRLLQHQYCLDEARRLDMARWLVAAKLQSQAEAARHYQRQGCGEAGETLASLRRLQEQAVSAESLAQVRGVEGAGSAAWFALYARLFRSPWVFPGRVRRPPTDPINALLSLSYQLLLTRASARCQALGLELHLGALHVYRAGRPSLACDVMEPLRVPAVDRLVVEMCNQGWVAPEQFVSAEGRGMRLRPAGMARTIESWEDHWLNAGHEAALETLLATLVRRFREQTPMPTSPLGEAEKLEEP